MTSTYTCIYIHCISV